MGTGLTIGLKLFGNNVGNNEKWSIEIWATGTRVWRQPESQNRLEYTNVHPLRCTFPINYMMQSRFWNDYFWILFIFSPIQKHTNGHTYHTTGNIRLVFRRLANLIEWYESLDGTIILCHFFSCSNMALRIQCQNRWPGHLFAIFPAQFVRCYFVILAYLFILVFHWQLVVVLNYCPW